MNEQQIAGEIARGVTEAEIDLEVRHRVNEDRLDLATKHGTVSFIKGEMLRWSVVRRTTNGLEPPDVAKAVTWLAGGA